MKFESLLRRSLSLELAITAILFCATVAYCQSTSFTYQGRLTDGGAAANGNYDLQFALFDSLSGGAQVGSTQTLNTVAVSNGVFTVSLDFGANAFPGASRFLEISARPSSGGAFTLLSPRQQITSTPYAVRSLNATTADTVTVNGTSAFSVNGAGASANSNTFVGVGAGAATTPNANGQGLLNSFFGNRAGQRNTTGGANSFFGRDVGFTNTTGSGNSFFGEEAGFSNTTGSFNSFFGLAAGVSTTTGAQNAFFGGFAGQQNTTGSLNSFFGYSAGEHSVGNLNTMIGNIADVLSGAPSVIDNATAIGARARVDASNSLVLGSIKNVNGATADTNVGIGTTTPQRKLNIKGAGADGFGVADLLVTGTGDIGAAITLESTGFGGRKFSWISTSSGADPGAGALAVFDPGASAYRMVINSFGQVGIGPSAPLDKLHVSGDIRVGTIGTNGCLKNNNGGTITGTCSSDARFKRDIRPFPNLLNRVTQLQPVHFYWRASEFPEKGFGNAENYGLVAQDVERALPELVSDDAEGFKQVDYSKLPLLLLQTIKELKAENDQLKHRLHRVERTLRTRSSFARRR